jgi:hypothetical protein
MSCYERPTVEIALDVPTGCPDETRPAYWEWTPCQLVPPVQEYVYTPEELCRVMRSWGELGSTVLRPSSYPRFRLRARGLVSGTMLGHAVWVWDPIPGRYALQGDLWITWPKPGDMTAAQKAAIAGRADGPQRVTRCAGCTIT